MSPLSFNPVTGSIQRSLEVVGGAAWTCTVLSVAAVAVLRPEVVGCDYPAVRMRLERRKRLRE